MTLNDVSLLSSDKGELERSIRWASLKGIKKNAIWLESLERRERERVELNAYEGLVMIKVLDGQRLSYVLDIFV